MIRMAWFVLHNAPPKLAMFPTESMSHDSVLKWFRRIMLSRIVKRTVKNGIGDQKEHVVVSKNGAPSTVRIAIVCKETTI